MKKKFWTIIIIFVILCGIMILVCTSLFSKEQFPVINDFENNNENEKINDKNTDVIGDENEELNQKKDSEINEKNTEIIHEEEFIQKKDDGTIVDSNSGNVLYNPKVEPENSSSTNNEIRIPEKIDESYIGEYLKYFFFLYSEQTLTSFNEEQIASIVALASELWSPRKSSEIAEVAKRYFNIDNYKLPTGTYKLKNYGEFSITKENDYYIRSDVKNKKESEYSNYLVDTKIDENFVILKYAYAKNGFSGEGYTPLNRDEKYIKGYHIVKLMYTSNGYHVISFEYRLK